MSWYYTTCLSRTRILATCVLYSHWFPKWTNRDTIVLCLLTDKRAQERVTPWWVGTQTKALYPWCKYSTSSVTYIFKYVELLCILCFAASGNIRCEEMFRMTQKESEEKAKDASPHSVDFQVQVTMLEIYNESVGTTYCVHLRVWCDNLKFVWTSPIRFLAKSSSLYPHIL